MRPYIRVVLGDTLFSEYDPHNRTYAHTINSRIVPHVCLPVDWDLDWPSEAAAFQFKLTIGQIDRQRVFEFDGHPEVVVNSAQLVGKEVRYRRGLTIPHMTQLFVKHLTML